MLVLLGRQEVTSRQQMKSLEDVNEIELASDVHAKVDDFVVLLVEVTDVLHVGHSGILIVVSLVLRAINR